MSGPTLPSTESGTAPRANQPTTGRFSSRRLNHTREPFPTSWTTVRIGTGVANAECPHQDGQQHCRAAKPATAASTLANSAARTTSAGVMISVTGKFKRESPDDAIQTFRETGTLGQRPLSQGEARTIIPLVPRAARRTCARSTMPRTAPSPSTTARTLLRAWTIRRAAYAIGSCSAAVNAGEDMMSRAVRCSAPRGVVRTRPMSCRRNPAWWTRSRCSSTSVSLIIP
jgi:hypothetical protein